MATPAQAKALETKALAASSKSEGMRMLLSNGYTVAQVRAIFSAPYGFVYGVAKRAGVVDTAAARRAPAKAKATAAKAPRTVRATAKPTTSTRRAAAKAPARAANRRRTVKA